MDKKYYTPNIEEFHVGFEYEYEDIIESGASDFFKATIENSREIDDLFRHMHEYGNQIRVKYLDEDDFNDFGFSNDIYPTLTSKSIFHKINGKYVIQIRVYWDQVMNGRENLIRIYKGILHRYPYAEIFRGDIKNKSELKRLLQQLNIL